MSTRDLRTAHRESGFVVSAELQLVALVLVLGLVAGWVKLRDQSLAEVNDAMAAVDAYVQGSAPVWQTGGTRWIVQGAIVGPALIGSVQESWGLPGSEFPALATEGYPGFPGVRRAREEFLTYGEVVPKG